MKKLKVGDIVKINKKHHDEIESRNEDIESMVDMVEALSKRLREKRKALWNFIGEIHPEVKTCAVSLDNKKNEIMIKAVGGRGE